MPRASDREFVLIAVVASVLTVAFSPVESAVDVARSVVAASVLAPLWRVSTVLQTQNGNPIVDSGELDRCRGVLQCWWKLCSEQGFLSLWHGFSALIFYTIAIALGRIAEDKLWPWAPYEATGMLDGMELNQVTYSPPVQTLPGLALRLTVGFIYGVAIQAVAYPFKMVYINVTSNRGSSSVTKGGTPFVLSMLSAHGALGLVKRLYTGFQLAVLQTAVLTFIWSRAGNDIIDYFTRDSVVEMNKSIMWVLQMDEFASTDRSENRNYSLKQAIFRKYGDSGNEINPYSEDEAVLMPMDLAHGLIGLSILRYSVVIVTSLALYGVSTVQNQLITQVGFSEPRFSSISQCCRRIWEEERAVGFMRGFLVSLDLYGALFLASGSIFADVARKFGGCMLTPGCVK